jgi:dolichol kinase
MAKTHEISTGKSVFGVLLPVAVCCFALIVFYGVLIAFVVSATQASHH